MSYNQNTTAFYYEICNLWQSQNMVQKNLQCFFVFSNNKDESYFKVPNLSFKIRNKSDFDSTEVKLWVTYDSLPDLISTIEKYFNDGQNNYIALSGHKYTFFISQYPTNDNQSYTSIKVSDSNDNSNDFVMRTNALKFMLNTLKQACENIVKISLDFIKVSQNNDIIKRLSSIENSLKYHNTNNIPETPQASDVTDIRTAQTIVDPDVNTQEVNQDMTQSINVSNNDPIVNQDMTKNVDVPFDPPFVDNVKKPTEVEYTPENNVVVNNALDYIYSNMKKEPSEKFKSQVLNHIKDVKNGNAEIKNLQRTIIESASITFAKEDLTFDNLSNYFYLTFSSYERVFKKLSLITEFHKYINSKVPLFIFKCRLNAKYTELTKEMNEALIDLYLEYRSKENGTEEEQHAYACMRYALAPFWSSYLAISDTARQSRPNILSSIKLLAIKAMQENAIEKKVDTFIYDNKLALEFKKDLAEDYFAQYCPTLFECLTNVNGDTPMEDVNMVKDIINQLKDTFAYQEVIYKDWYDINKLSDNFVKNLYTFNKIKNFTSETPLEKLNEYYTNEVLKKDVNNIRNEIKALSAIDVNNGELQKKEKEPVSAPELNPDSLIRPEISKESANPVVIPNEEPEKPDNINKPIESSVNPMDFLI
jgi:hypothetical protein